MASLAPSSSLPRTPAASLRRNPAAPWRHLDVSLVGAALAIASLGTLMVYSATRSTQGTTFLAKQGTFLLVGIGVMIVASVIDYRRVRDAAPILYAGCLGLLMAGTLKAEATLAAANLVFLLLLIGGGVIVSLETFPDALSQVLRLLPISALSDGLRDVLRDGAGVPWGDLALLAVWAVLGLGAAARFFRWE